MTSDDLDDASLFDGTAATVEMLQLDDEEMPPTPTRSTTMKRG